MSVNLQLFFEIITTFAKLFCFMDVLELIKRPIIGDLDAFRDEFELSLQHTNPLLDSVLKLVSSRKGKMMRPILTLLSSKLFGGVNSKTLSAACTFEFFHTASLLHDDVVDESDQRRGQLSANKAYSNQIAVLVGDYILSLSLANAAKSGLLEVVDMLSVTAQNLADGELAQLDYINNTSFSEDIYYHIITNKTAALFAACAKSGAFCVGASESDCETLRMFGETLGIAFQIRDDIFDYNDDKSIGKPTGNDMKEGKLTLPVLYALNSTQSVEMMDIARKVRSGEVTEEEVKSLVEFTKKSGGIEYAEKMMLEFGQKAKNLLSKYPDSDVKQSLLLYVDYVIGRTI